MGWDVLFLLHLFCAMAAVAGVHSQGNATAVAHYQAFEGEAVHNMMQSWLSAGTSPGLFDSWGWNIHGHPCYENNSRSWQGISCSSRSIQLEDNNLVMYHMLVRLELPDVFVLTVDDRMPLVGELPLAIMNLTNLDHLLISNANKLSSPLPTGFFCFSQVLQLIELRNCSFYGSISRGFGSGCNNTVLQHLDLSGNFFSEMSPIPSKDNINNYLNYFYELQYLNVSNNQIKGEFDIGVYNSKIVDMSNNFITDIIDSRKNKRPSRSLKSIYAQNNSIRNFPSEIFGYETLEDINLDLNDISSIKQNISSINVPTIRRISMSKNKFQVFPEELLQLPNLEEIILDSNNIIGVLHLPNIPCENSKIKLISLLYNNITNVVPSSNTTSCFSLSSILSGAKVFLYGNPICTGQIYKSKLLRFVCRINATSPIKVMDDIEPKKSHKILNLLVGSISGCVGVVSIMGFFVIRKLKQEISFLHTIQSEFDKRDVKPNLYSFNELKVATQDFHITNELGRGGFGIVYKGILPDGSYVAVKKLNKLSMEQGIQDFLSEIIVVSHIKHRNLVQLKGCCIREKQRILVHEFVENENLEDALWGDSRSDKHLDWPTRFNIILGIARGLAYLHEDVQPAIVHRDIKGENILLDKDYNPKIARGLAYLHEDVQPAIVHRDIKGENILLDKDYNPKIADFGLALFFPSLDDGETHMSVSKVAGTKGYMAPEYLCYGQVSTKLDVFSFGMLLLEIVSGRKKIDIKLPSLEQYLVQWAQELHSNDNLASLKDKSLGEMSMVEEATIEQVIKVGLQCLHHIAARRPTMSEVVAMLVGNKNVDDCTLEDYNEGSSSSYGTESSSFCFPIPKSSLGCIIEDDDSLDLDLENYKQSL